ncbi:MAG: nitrous oxide reductase family maturation protein NosD, partial [Kangiellaceae bacterium]|nr:nitrous oxide reductase family maturation protein NosD [Kangiellaceae bacterium]
MNKLLCYIAITFCIQANAETYRVSSSNELINILTSAKTDDEILLNPGSYLGNFKIDKPITIDCQNKATLDGNNSNDTLRITAPNVSIKNCRIINWGDDLTDMNAGIFAEKTATDLVIDNNYFKGTTFGIWLDSSKSATIQNNKVEGDLETRSQDRGNGIHLFNVTDTLVQNNEVWHARDGIYIDTSNNNKLIGNYLHDLRYGIHYMYSHSNLVKDNRTFQTRTAYALMQSKYLTVINNTSENDTNYGILMNYISYSTIKDNKIIRIHQQQGPGGEQYIQGAEGKALFMYNAPFNEVSGNLVQESEIAIHLTAGSEGNKIHGNYFVKNRRQVKYVANREVEWSLQGRGNYWSDYQGW